MIDCLHERTVMSKNNKLQYRLYSIGISCIAGFIAGSILHGLLRAYTKDGPFWAICMAGTLFVILLYNWLKAEESSIKSGLLAHAEGIHPPVADTETPITVQELRNLVYPHGKAVSVLVTWTDGHWQLLTAGATRDDADVAVCIREQIEKMVQLGPMQIVEDRRHEHVSTALDQL